MDVEDLRLLGEAQCSLPALSQAVRPSDQRDLIRQISFKALAPATCQVLSRCEDKITAPSKHELQWVKENTEKDINLKEIILGDGNCSKDHKLE